MPDTRSPAGEVARRARRPGPGTAPWARGPAAARRAGRSGAGEGMSHPSGGFGRLDAVDVRVSPHLLASVREAALAGRVPPEPPRTVIGESWRRSLDQGVDPDTGGHD